MFLHILHEFEALELEFEVLELIDDDAEVADNVGRR